MTQLLSPQDLYNLRRFNGIKNFLEDEQKREIFLDVIVTFRADNANTDQFMHAFFQIEIVKGYLKLYADDLKTVYYSIDPDATDIEVSSFLDLVARYYLDLADDCIP